MNQGPADLQSAALTTELCTHIAISIIRLFSGMWDCGPVNDQFRFLYGVQSVSSNWPIGALPAFAIGLDVIGKSVVRGISANAKNLYKIAMQLAIDIFNCPPSSVGRAQGP